VISPYARRRGYIDHQTAELRRPTSSSSRDDFPRRGGALNPRTDGRPDPAPPNVREKRGGRAGSADLIKDFRTFHAAGPRRPVDPQPRIPDGPCPLHPPGTDVRDRFSRRVSGWGEIPPLGARPLAQDFRERDWVSATYGRQWLVCAGLGHGGSAGRPRSQAPERPAGDQARTAVDFRELDRDLGGCPSGDGRREFPRSAAWPVSAPRIVKRNPRAPRRYMWPS